MKTHTLKTYGTYQCYAGGEGTEIKCLGQFAHL